MKSLKNFGRDINDAGIIVNSEGNNFKINEFKSGIRNTRSLFSGEVLKGGEISHDDIIKRYIEANAQRYMVMDKMKRTNDLAQLLEVTPHVISSKNKDADNEELRKRFDKGHINTIGSFKMLKQGANLKDAKVAPEQLAQAKSLKGATMPDGTIHE